jgi:hypothetical protein
MDPTPRVTSTLNNEGTPLCKAGPSELRLATHSEDSAGTSVLQAAAEAQRCEGIARRHALRALCLGGALAFQHAALRSHYARRAVSLMRGRQQGET